MIAWLLAEFGGWLAGAGAILLAIVTAWWRGWSSARQEASLDDAMANIATRRRMDDVQNDTGALPDDARRWLRDRPPNQR